MPRVCCVWRRAGASTCDAAQGEHVVCAGGETVLAPGEMSFHQGSGSWEVGEVTNQSTRIPPQEWDVGVDVDVAEETRP